MKQQTAIQKVLEYLNSQPEKEATRSQVFSRALKCGISKGELETLENLLSVTGQIEVILRKAKALKTATRTATIWRLK